MDNVIDFDSKKEEHDTKFYSERDQFYSFEDEDEDDDEDEED